MTNAPAKRALAHLLELADKGPALRAALTEELRALLAAWPDHYPSEIRLVCEALLEKTTHEIEAVRAQEDEDRPDANLAAALVTAARKGAALPRIFADRLGISRARAEGIFAEPTGREFVIVCKGAHLGRATFSAITILAGDPGILAEYEAVAERDAERTFDAWRAMDRFSRAAA